ncbi:MAG: phosphoenolpyruvate--protein phosphotransferase [Lachnospiraceae bacterium]|nr:phosphoenolpyruvate--protein phosphotransferase [Lachnospiraceae bacterium]
MKKVKGLSASKGYAIGEMVVKGKHTKETPKFSITDYKAEELRFRKAQAEYNKELDALYIKTKEEISENDAEIFQAYQTILHDEELFGKALKRSAEEMVNIEYAIECECNGIVAIFETMDDEYLRERATDIQNVCKKVIEILLGGENDFLKEIEGKSDLIIVADDLAPSETVVIDKTKLRALVTEKGGVTSHTAILAKAMGIPAIVGASGILAVAETGEKALVNAFKGEIILEPTAEEEKSFALLKEEYDKKNKVYKEAEKAPAISLDGVKMNVNINSGDKESMEIFNPDVCDGIGLFRTEFLYMDGNDYPDEERQYKVYSTIAEKAKGKEVIIRTLDIGGDKEVPYMNLPKEDNPFLGYRAIRICLNEPEIFMTQLRAILRATAHGNIKIMFPMIVNLEEVLKAKEMVEKAKKQLLEEGHKVSEHVDIGIMIETPAAVMLSDVLAEHVDFFSIGSNDLIQYTTATDRLNEKVQHLYDCCNISFLRSVKMIAENAKKAGKYIGICGETASEAILIPLWLALGIDELSVAPSQLGKVKYLIGRMAKTSVQELMNEVMSMHKIEDVRARLESFLEEIDR